MKMVQITTANRIGRELMNAREGDEFKVRTESGYYLREEISHVQDDVVGHDRELCLGPADGPHLLLYVDETGESIGDLKSYHTFAMYDNGDEYEERGDVTELYDLRGL